MSRHLGVAPVVGAPVALALARFPLGRLRFALVMAMGSALAEVGATGAAVAVYVRERRRCDHKVAAIRVRRVDHR